MNCSWSGYWPIAMYALYCKLADETQHLIRCLLITVVDENIELLVISLFQTEGLGA